MYILQDVAGHNGVSVGDVVTTKAYHIPGTKAILHAILSNWKQNSSPKVIILILNHAISSAFLSKWIYMNIEMDNP